MVWDVAPIPNENTTAYIHLIDYVNSVTDGYFGMSIVLMVFIVSYLGAANITGMRRFSVSLFSTGIMVMLLAWGGIVNDRVVLLVWALLLGSIGLMYGEKKLG